jgi:hypothetical protein
MDRCRLNVPRAGGCGQESEFVAPRTALSRETARATVDVQIAEEEERHRSTRGREII